MWLLSGESRIDQRDRISRIGKIASICHSTRFAHGKIGNTGTSAAPMIPMLRILAKRRAGASKPICRLFHLFYQVQIRLGCPRRGRRSGMIIPSPCRKASATNRSRCQLGPTHLLERCFAELLIRRTLTRAKKSHQKRTLLRRSFLATSKPLAEFSACEVITRACCLS